MATGQRGFKRKATTTEEPEFYKGCKIAYLITRYSVYAKATYHGKIIAQSMKQFKKQATDNIKRQIDKRVTDDLRRQIDKVL